MDTPSFIEAGLNTRLRAFFSLSFDISDTILSVDALSNDTLSDDS